MVSPGEPTQVLRPSRRGRLDFEVDLGPAHRDQQYTAASKAAGGGSGTYFTSRHVKLEPHAALKLSRLHGPRSKPRACVRALGTAVTRQRISLRKAGGRIVAGSVRFSQPVGERHCTVLSRPGGKRLKRGRYALRTRARDGFGHRVSAERSVRLR